MSNKVALTWVGISTGIVLFTAALIAYGVEQKRAWEFLSVWGAYTSLKVDNLFAMIGLFVAYRIATQTQAMLLPYAIGGMVTLQIISVVAIGVLLQSIVAANQWVFYILAGAIFLLAGKLWKNLDAHSSPIAHKDRWIVRQIKRRVPVSGNTDSNCFFVIEDGVRKITPALLCVIAIIGTDGLIALDEVPVAMSITDSVVVMFLACGLNVLAIRPLLKLLSELANRFVYVGHAVVLALVFIASVTALKAADLLHMHPALNFAVLVVVLGGGVLFSVIATRYQNSKEIALENTSAITAS